MTELVVVRLCVVNVGIDVVNIIVVIIYIIIRFLIEVILFDCIREPNSRQEVCLISQACIWR
jgi:hypothetical protein